VAARVDASVCACEAPKDTVCCIRVMGNGDEEGTQKERQLNEYEEGLQPTTKLARCTDHITLWE
jgi:hypothetical protein